MKRSCREGRRVFGKRGQEGFALLLTVWLLTLLAVIAGEFLFSSRMSIIAQRNSRETAQSYGLAIAGYQAALERLSGNISRLGRDDEGNLLLYERGDAEGLPAAAESVPLGGGTYSYRIDDEDGRINIGRQPRPVLAAILREAGIPPGVERDVLADSILDWIDTNREHRINGAEEDYYRSLEPPYSCKDGPLDEKEELLLVRGMREEYFFGGEFEGSSILPLRDLVTIYPAVLNHDTASDEVLRALGRARPRAPAPPSRFYRITATGEAGEKGLRRSIEAVVSRTPRGGKETFTLLYWNDNFSPKGPTDAMD